MFSYSDTHTQAEQDALRRRLEEEELADCTFVPNTKWHLVAERRQRAKDEQYRMEKESSNIRQPRLTVCFFSDDFSCEADDDIGTFILMKLCVFFILTGAGETTTNL